MFSQLNMERHFVSWLAAWFVLRHSPVACPRKSDFDVLSAKFDLSEIVLLAIQGYTFIITCDSCDSELQGFYQHWKSGIPETFLPWMMEHASRLKMESNSDSDIDVVHFCSHVITLTCSLLLGLSVGKSFTKSLFKKIYRTSGFFKMISMKHQFKIMDVESVFSSYCVFNKGC